MYAVNDSTLNAPALFTALAAVQAEIKDASKSSENPHFHSKYADIAEVLQTLRPVLSKHGLSVTQFPGAFDKAAGTIALTTILGHSSGEYLGETMTIPVAKADPQGAGAAITYARRYALAAVCGLAQEDDDGETASGRGGGAPKPAATKAKPKTPSPTMSAGQLAIAFDEAGTLESIQKLAGAYASLPAEEQAAVLPHVKEARKRAGL